MCILFSNKTRNFFYGILLPFFLSITNANSPTASVIQKTSSSDINLHINQSDIKTVLPIDSFVLVKQLSGKFNYYTKNSDSTEQNFFRAHYLPKYRIARLGYKFYKPLSDVSSISWRWRVVTPPLNADERFKGKNDSGASVYMIFKIGIDTYIIKYVYSTVVPVGTTIRRDPFYPLQRMAMVVTNTWNNGKKDKWEQVNVNVRSDFMRLFETDSCPPLQGIGILTDGDGTDCEVIGDYSSFTIVEAKK